MDIITNITYVQKIIEGQIEKNCQFYEKVVSMKRRGSPKKLRKKLEKGKETGVNFRMIVNTRNRP